MSLQRLAGVVVVGLLASVAAMTLAAANGERLMTGVAAAAFAALVLVVAIAVNRPAWQTPQALAADAVGMVRRNARLAALVYAWGAAAMFAIYHLSGLAWRHGWQYGLGMALLSGVLLAFVHRLGGRSKVPPLALTLLHGAAALCALIYLVGTGKLETVKTDWAANHVFLFGGLAIVALNVIAAITQVRLSSAQR